MLLYSFFTFSDCWTLKIEHENNMKTLTTKVPHMGVPLVQVYIETNPGWQELSLTKTNFHGPKPVRATEVLHFFTISELL